MFSGRFFLPKAHDMMMTLYMHVFHTQRFKFIIVGMIIAAVALSFAAIVATRRAEAPGVLSFEDCVARGYSLLESFPPKCIAPDGQQFVSPTPIAKPDVIDAGNSAEKADKIVVTNIKAGDTIASPLTIEGQARGTWYFEASFPVELQDAAGKQLVILPAQAKDEWMTENFVPFSVTFEFPAQLAGSIGKLILHKDNPSGLPEYDDALVIPVKF
jgi:hypothetical protein